MKRPSRLAPALLLAAALSLVALPVHAGGRDVPDAKKYKSGGPAQGPVSQPPAACNADTVLLDLGLIRLDLRFDGADAPGIRPSFFREIHRLVFSLNKRGLNPDRSCPRR